MKWMYVLYIWYLRKLLDYLLRQSANYDYNCETIYSLLLDPINPRDAEDFVAMLKRYAGKNILDAVNTVDLTVFHTTWSY